MVKITLRRILIDLKHVYSDKKKVGIKFINKRCFDRISCLCPGGTYN